jgi:hypothetical protein
MQDRSLERSEWTSLRPWHSQCPYVTCIHFWEYTIEVEKYLKNDNFSTENKGRVYSKKCSKHCKHEDILDELYVMNTTSSKGNKTD